MPPADAPRPRLVVLADDRTGAADAAVPFAARGTDVRVALEECAARAARAVRRRGASHDSLVGAIMAAAAMAQARAAARS